MWLSTGPLVRSQGKALSGVFGYGSQEVGQGPFGLYALNLAYFETCCTLLSEIVPTHEITQSPLSWSF